MKTFLSNCYLFQSCNAIKLKALVSLSHRHGGSVKTVEAKNQGKQFPLLYRLNSKSDWLVTSGSIDIDQ